MKRNWLIKIRNSKRFTQQYVASNSFIDRSFYSHIESGKRNPSLAVAKNIAAVLEFDPLIFFKEDVINEASEITNLIQDIDTLLRNMVSGHILYLYNNFNSYINYAVLFLLIGVCKKCSCFIIDSPTNFSRIKKNLKKNLAKNEMNKYIHYINKEELMNQSPELNNTSLKMLLTKLESENYIFLWFHVRRDHQNDWIFKLQNQLNSGDFINNNKIITLHSYDASIVSAHTHIELMRRVPYLMTDSEIVESPLYHSSSKAKIYPSLYMQEDSLGN